MDRRQASNQQLGRERAVYHYLAALEAGDIDGIIEVLQQAAFDASLDQMVAEAHEAYVQEEHAQKAAMGTQLDIPVPLSLPSRPRSTQSRRHVASWLQVLAAVMIIGILVGSFLEILHLRQSGAGMTGVLPAHLVCTPGSWHSVDTQTQGALQSIAAISPTDAWAVGYVYDGSDLSQREPLIEHWNGRQWSMASRTAISGTLNAVAAVSPNDVWAVGSQSGTPGKKTVEHTLIEHWDGQQWRLMPSPAAITMEGVAVVNILNSVAAISANDVWAAGVTFVPHGGKAWILIEHWDGQRWSIVFDQGNQPTPGWGWGVTAVSANDVRVYGYKLVKNQNHLMQALVEHWDGNRWQDVTTAQFEQASVVISSLSVRSANDIWALGQAVHTIKGQGQSTNVLLAHWNGQKWSLLPGPSWLVGANSQLSQVLAVAGKNVWIAGALAKSGQGNQAFVAHWDGKTWQQIQLPQPNQFSGTETIVGSIAVAGEAVWAVGSIVGKEGSPNYILIEQQFTCK